MCPIIFDTFDPYESYHVSCLPLKSDKQAKPCSYIKFAPSFEILIARNFSEARTRFYRFTDTKMGVGAHFTRTLHPFISFSHIRYQLQPRRHYLKVGYVQHKRHHLIKRSFVPIEQSDKKATTLASSKHIFTLFNRQ